MTEISLRSVATALLQSALKIAPQHAAEWGRAMLGELQHVEGDWAAFAWAAGGAGVLAKHALLSLVIPGQSDEIVPSVAKENPMRKSTLIAAAACLAACLLFFAVPSFRQGLGLVLLSWHGYREPQTARWQEFGHEAENKSDAAAMAYAAMRLPMNDAIPLAQHAVAIDPSLTWVYCFIHHNNFPPPPDSRARRLELLAALSKWDPDNAVPYLAIAANTTFSFQAETYKDPKWLDAMNHAMAAKSYDSYFARRLELQRRVNQTPSVNDTMGNLASYWIQMPWISTLNEYAAFLQRRAEEAGNREVQEKAGSQLWALANLGSQIHVSALSFGEKYDASEMQEVAFAHLQPVLLKLGRTQEAQAVGYAARLEAEHRTDSMPRRVIDDAFLDSSAAAAHLLAVLMMACVLLLAIVGPMFAARRKVSGFVRAVLTYVPTILLSSCAAFLWVSYPYAQAARSFLSNPLDSDAILHLASLSLVHPLNINWYLFPKALYFWWGVIALGSALCLWMGLRAFRHRQTSAPASQ